MVQIFHVWLLHSNSAHANFLSPNCKPGGQMDCGNIGYRCVIAHCLSQMTLFTAGRRRAKFTYGITSELKRQKTTLFREKRLTKLDPVKYNTWPGCVCLLEKNSITSISINIKCTCRGQKFPLRFEHLIGHSDTDYRWYRIQTLAVSIPDVPNDPKDEFGLNSTLFKLQILKRVLNFNKGMLRPNASVRSFLTSVTAF